MIFLKNAFFLKKIISRKPRNIAKNEAFLSKNQKFQKNAKKIEKTIDFWKSMCYNITVVFGMGIFFSVPVRNKIVIK